MDKGYDNAEGELEAIFNGYVLHIRRIGEEKLDVRGRKIGKARR